MNIDNALIMDRARKRKLKVDADNRGRIVLRNDKRVRTFNPGWPRINGTMARRCVRYRNISSALLRARGVNAAQSMTFQPDELTLAWHWSRTIKEVRLGSHATGRNFWKYPDPNDHDAFKVAFATIADKYGHALVEEVVSGVIHRALIVDNEIVGVTRYLQANVVGDGTSDVAALTEAKNRLRIASNNPLEAQIRLGKPARRELQRQGLKVKSVPQNGQFVSLHRQTSIRSGADIVDATDDLNDMETDLLLRAVRVFTGLRVASIDAMLPGNGATGEPCIVAVHHNPTLAPYHFPSSGETRDAAAQLVRAMFPA